MGRSYPQRGSSPLRCRFRHGNFENCIGSWKAEWIKLRTVAGYPVQICCLEGVKLLRAYGGCLGRDSRRRTRSAAKSLGELQTSFDPGVSELGNRAGVSPVTAEPIHNSAEGTEGTETSKYLEEKKATAIP